MKISVSIPDDLWAAAALDESSRSQVVQDALHALVQHRAASEDRMADAAARIESRPSPAGDEPGSGWSVAILDALEDQARELHDTGYRMALEIAGQAPWLVLDALPTGARLRDELLRWAGNGATTEVDGIGLLMGQALSDWDSGLDEVGDPITSPVLYAGVAAGLDDTRDAVRERLRASGLKGAAS